MQGAVLRDTKRAGRRNRLVAALTLPAVILVWFVGWSLYYIGSRISAKPKQQTGKPSENVSLIPAIVVHGEPLEASA